MKRSPVIFQAEREAGLAELVGSANAVSLLARAEAATAFPLAGRAVAAAGDMDLHFLKAVLVTTCWNKNDDVFDVIETWAARHTPEDKPVNYQHDCAKIIGHITGNCAVGEDGAEIPDDSAADALPSKYHLVTRAVLYKVWPDPELQEWMDGVLAGVAKGEWFVSMEALFHGFDYALLGDDGSNKIVARNAETAFLTKHLRAYGGTGRYGNAKVGRLLRNIVFSGKGLVKNPANPESVIFAAEFGGAAVAATAADLGYTHATTVPEERSVMPTEVEALQSQVTALKAENDSLQKSLRDGDVKQLTKAAADANADAAEAKAKADAAEAERKKVADELAATQAKLAEAESEAQKAAAELAAVKAAQQKADRLAKLKAALKVGADAEAVKKAETLFASVEDISDEKFELFLKSQAGFTTPAPTPPQSTPAPLPPKVTSLPAPQGGKASADDLDKAKVEPDAALAVAEPPARKSARENLSKAFSKKGDK